MEFEPMDLEVEVPHVVRKRPIGGGVDGFWCDGALLERECAALVERCDRIGYNGIQQLYSIDMRNNDRAFIFSKPSAEALFRRVGHLLPQSVLHEGCRWTLQGLHDVFRINRYRPGQYFHGHTDTPYRCGPDEQSFYSVLFYLNAPAAGGRTLFLGSRNQPIAAVQPAAGRLAVFNHQTLHAGEELPHRPQTQKHAMRTDAIYRREICRENE